LKGNAVNGFRTTSSEERESFENAFGGTVMPRDAFRKGPGEVCFGISSLAGETIRPLTQMKIYFGKNKKELKEEGWQPCILCHAIDSDFSDFWDRRFKIGWIEHLMQERFRESKHLELMWSSFKERPLHGENKQGLSDKSGKMYLYMNWLPT
jgi:hypothetical protein